MVKINDMSIWTVDFNNFKKLNYIAFELHMIGFSLFIK